MANALKSINARVKVLQKKHPKSKRTTLQKQAGREWKAGKLKAKRKKKVVKRKNVKRKVGSSGNTRTATHAATSRNRTATTTKTITAHVKVGAVKKKKYSVLLKRGSGKDTKVTISARNEGDARWAGKKKAGVYEAVVLKRIGAVKKRKVYKAKVVRVKAYKANRYRRVGSSKSIMPMVAIGALALGAVYLLTKSNTAPSYQYQPTGNYQRDNSANSILTWATAAGIGASAIAKIIEALNRSSDATVTNAAANPNDYVQQFLGGD